MRILLQIEVISLLVTPLVLGSLIRHKRISWKVVPAVASGLLSLLLGTSALYFRNANSAASLGPKDWLESIAALLVCFGITFPMARWFLKLWIQR